MNKFINCFLGLDEPIERATQFKRKVIRPISLTPGLNQGISFNKYQRTKKREGFHTLTEQSNNVLRDTMSYEDINDPTIENSQNIALTAYSDLIGGKTESAENYIKRISPDNPFLNKYLRFSANGANGAIMYVTNQGIAKHVLNPSILSSLLSKNGCPNMETMKTTSLTWNPNYFILGSTIPTDPPLIVGSPMTTLSQSCGQEGSNIYVNSVMTDSTATYVGCYADNPQKTRMTFIGGDPPTSTTAIKNGNFSAPIINRNSYQYINSNSTVYGWNYHAVLLNNSSAWLYPTPYPNGFQCCSLQRTQYIEQIISLSLGKYTLSFFACGRNCCDGTNPIKVLLNNNIIINANVTPPTEWTFYSFSFDVSITGNNAIKFAGTTASGDKSSAIQNIQISNSDVKQGTYTYEKCKSEAIDNGASYFALQNVNPTTSTGYCGISNNEVATNSTEPSYVVTGGTSIWSSTNTTPGTSASLTNQGALTVYNSSNTAIYSTSNSSATPANYIGCYLDDSTDRTMTSYIGTGKNYATCKQEATNANAKYFGLQNSTSGTNAECYVSSDIVSIRKKGKSNLCSQITDGTYSGGGTSNAIYNNSDPSSFYYLVLPGNGNMRIHRGKGPGDDQGIIWESNTQRSTLPGNPSYAASKGKYGTNWVTSGFTLAVNEFIGCPDGSTYLIMQPDGKLSLNISTNAENCSIMADNKKGGGYLGNAVYKFNTVVDSSNNVGKIAYIDSNSLLYEYPVQNIGLSTTYDYYNNYNSVGNDISGNSFSSATVPSCIKHCNDNKDCYGFVYDTQNNICRPKKKEMYPNGSKTLTDGMDLYVRRPKIINPPTGIPTTMVSTDSMTYNHYEKAGSDKLPTNSFSFNNANPTQNDMLRSAQTALNNNSEKLTEHSDMLVDDYLTVSNQISANTAGIGTYLDDYETTNSKINSFDDNNITNIVNDSDINVLKENYNYLSWSILAVGGALLTMSIAKNQ